MYIINSCTQQQCNLTSINSFLTGHFYRAKYFDIVLFIECLFNLINSIVTKKMSKYM